MFCHLGSCSIDEDCGFAFFCDVDDTCQRDCNEFDIDGFLQCSILFGNVRGNLSLLIQDVDDLEDTIQDFSNYSAVDALLQAQIDDITDDLDELSRRFRRQSKGRRSNANINPMRLLFDDNGSETQSLWNTSAIKDVLIIGLLIYCFVLTNYMFCCGKSKPNVKYVNVSEQDLKDSE